MSQDIGDAFFFLGPSGLPLLLHGLGVMVLQLRAQPVGEIAEIVAYPDPALLARFGFAETTD